MPVVTGIAACFCIYQCACQVLFCTCHCACQACHWSAPGFCRLHVGSKLWLSCTMERFCMLFGNVAADLFTSAGPGIAGLLCFGCVRGVLKSGTL